MKRFLKNIFSTIIGIISSLIILFILFAIILTSISSKKEIKVKENSILKIDFSKNTVVERSSNNPFNDININSNTKSTIELKDVLDNIENAKTDNNIKGIYINSSIVNAGLSQTEEIRNKLLEFKKTGKPIVAYSEVYSQLSYYLSSIANKVYLNPEGIIELKGLSASQMFFKGLLKKLDIEIQIIRHGKFKSAIEPFILEKMSDENKKQMKVLLNSFADNIMDSIASQRKLSLSIVQKDANNLNLEDAESCLRLGYVDYLLYEDQVEDTLLNITESEKNNFISLNEYKKRKSAPTNISRNKIAIIYATGSIKSGEGDEKSIGSITTANAIEKARKNKNVKAIVLRINSGGGSALASDIILREAILAKKEKPFVVSMGDYAASGGYYIACAADSIVANPTTLTGSIGVFGMIPNLQKFYKNKLGITFDNTNTNNYADMGINRPLSDFEKNKIQKSIANVYNTFIGHVAKGREMSISAVDEIAQGRVWTGYDAKMIGLIDTYGGIEKAINIAAKLAGIKEYRINSLPEPKDPFVKIMEQFNTHISLSKSLFSNLGIEKENIYAIDEITKNDYIQARIPFVITFGK